MLTAFYASPTSQSSELLKRWKNIAAVANRESETFFLQNRESKQKKKLEKTVEKMFNFNLPKHTRILDVMLDTWCKKIFIAYNKLEIILRCHKKFEQHYILSPMWMWMQRKKKNQIRKPNDLVNHFFLREIEGEQKNCVLVYIGGCYWNRSGFNMTTKVRQNHWCQLTMTRWNTKIKQRTVSGTETIGNKNVKKRRRR